MSAEVGVPIERRIFLICEWAAEVGVPVGESAAAGGGAGGGGDRARFDELATGLGVIWARQRKARVQL